MFPSRSSYPTRAAFARPASGCRPVSWLQSSYAALRLPCCVGRRSGFPLPSAYHGANACSEPAPRAFADARRAGGVWGRGLRKPRMARGQTGASQVTGPSSSSAPRSSTPPREAPPRPVAVTPPAAFRVGDPLGFPGRTISGLHTRGSLVRLPTHQPSHCWLDCKADYRPAGLGFGRAGFAPAGRQTEFHEVIAPLLPDQHCLVASTKRVFGP